MAGGSKSTSIHMKHSWISRRSYALLMAWKRMVSRSRTKEPGCKRTGHLCNSISRKALRCKCFVNMKGEKTLSDTRTLKIFIIHSHSNTSSLCCAFLSVFVLVSASACGYIFSLFRLPLSVTSFVFTELIRYILIPCVLLYRPLSNQFKSLCYGICVSCESFRFVYDRQETHKNWQRWFRCDVCIY